MNEESESVRVRDTERERERQREKGGRYTPTDWLRLVRVSRARPRRYIRALIYLTDGEDVDDNKTHDCSLALTRARDGGPLLLPLLRPRSSLRLCLPSGSVRACVGTTEQQPARETCVQRRAGGERERRRDDDDGASVAVGSCCAIRAATAPAICVANLDRSAFRNSVLL